MGGIEGFMANKDSLDICSPIPALPVTCNVTLSTDLMFAAIASTTQLLSLNFLLWPRELRVGA